MKTAFGVHCGWCLVQVSQRGLRRRVKRSITLKQQIWRKQLGKVRISSGHDFSTVSVDGVVGLFHQHLQNIFDML